MSDSDRDWSPIASEHSQKREDEDGEEEGRDWSPVASSHEPEESEHGDHWTDAVGLPPGKARRLAKRKRQDGGQTQNVDAPEDDRPAWAESEGFQNIVGNIRTVLDNAGAMSSGQRQRVSEAMAESIVEAAASAATEGA